MTASCIYAGTVRHRRLHPASEFTHRLAMVYVDLDELPALLHGRLARQRPGLLRFRRRDYHGDPSTSLPDAVRDTVTAHTGSRPCGAIRLLTQLRSFGRCFNPVSFYYCMSADGEGVEAILTEVTNTPWGERQDYVIPAGCSTVLGATFDKAMHVSPFMPMNQTYAACATVPGKTLSVHIENHGAGERAFDATLSLRRRELTPASARWLTLRYPLATVRVLALIYGHAVALKLSGARVHPHPRARSA